jgi:hypothetical protein
VPLLAVDVAVITVEYLCIVYLLLSNEARCLIKIAHNLTA